LKNNRLNMPFFAIMQGRLVPPEAGRFQSFPRDAWRREFSLAADAELNGIEWIFDTHGEDVNPLVNDTGIAEMLSLSQQTGIIVRSLCADYFMDKPLLRTGESERQTLIQKMRWLLSRCKLAGIRRVVIPFVDSSRIENQDEAAQVISTLQSILPAAETNEVELHLETSLAPEQFARLLDRCNHPLVRVNYDSGNSASLGYAVTDELAAYGRRIGSVHIKDRQKGGGTVPLGTGNADLSGLFCGLAKLNYDGDYVLQIARSVPGQEVSWIAQNLAFIASQIEMARELAS
jgi:L-ribulose-5-phosphate 3-epimerase